MESLENTCNVQAAIEAGKELSDLKLVDIGGVQHALVPDGMMLRSFEELQERPSRISQEKELREPVSFIDYVNQFKDDNTRLYGSINCMGCRITAIIDDNEADNGKARFCSHKATLKLYSSPEWQLWAGNNKEYIPQKEFAEFLQENISCIAQPDHAMLLECTRKFIVKRNATVTSVVYEGGGLAVDLQEEVRGQTKGETVSMPTEIVLGLRPFEQAPKYQVKVALRFREKNGGIEFAYSMIEPERIVESAFKDIREEVEKGTEINVLV
jgi:uncharacterized protein YfdQ (DUF2303 family)